MSMEAAGATRRLAKVGEPHSAVFSAFFDHFNIDPACWQEKEFPVPPVHDQGSRGSTCGHAAAAAVEVLLRRAGKEAPPLSGDFLYDLTTGGRDFGATLNGIMAVLRADGVCPVNGKREDAVQYKPTTVLVCRNYDELCEAVQRGLVPVFAIWVGPGFHRLNPDGTAAITERQNGATAFVGIGLKKSVKGTWLLKAQGTWGERWGQNGCCYLSRGHFERWVEGYAVSFEPILPKEPPPAIENKLEEAVVPAGEARTEIPQPPQQFKKKHR